MRKNKKQIHRVKRERVRQTVANLAQAERKAQSPERCLFGSYGLLPAHRRG